jgi:hypothetical protein
VIRGGEVKPVRRSRSRLPPRGVDGERERVEAGHLGAREHRVVQALVLVDVELEQLRAGRQARDLLDRRPRDRGRPK